MGKPRQSKGHHESGSALQSPPSRRAIAAQAARLMAEDGIADFGAAKRKAARHLGYSDKDALPSNDEVEIELRTYQGLFQRDEQRERLEAMRTVALDVMQRWEKYHPRLSGPAWNGTAGRESIVEIELFVDDEKTIQIQLLGLDIPLETTEHMHFNRALTRRITALTLEHDGFLVRLSLYRTDDLRGAVKPDASGGPARGDLAAVAQLREQAREEAQLGATLAGLR